MPEGGLFVATTRLMKLHISFALYIFSFRLLIGNIRVNNGNYEQWVKFFIQALYQTADDALTAVINSNHRKRYCKVAFNIYVSVNQKSDPTTLNPRFSFTNILP